MLASMLDFQNISSKISSNSLKRHSLKKAPVKKKTEKESCEKAKERALRALFEGDNRSKGLS
eukprot:c22798_g1_i1 orf=1-183(-)